MNNTIDLNYSGYITKCEYVNGIKLTTRIPQKVSESVKQAKINIIYDILSGKKSDEKLS